MARMRKPGWNPCEEFQKDRNKKSVNNVLKTGKLLEEVSSSSNSENLFSNKSQRIKTLTRAVRSEVPRLKADLKAMLPKLEAVEVRRFRIPYYDAVILELEEEGLLETADYIIDLFDLDEKMRNKAGPGSAIWRKPKLGNEKKLLERVKDGLRSAELARRSGNTPVQAAAFLDTAIYFESQTWEWHWIAEKLYRTCLKIGEEIEDDEGQIFNVIKYLYGRFLFDKMSDPKEALDYLNEVRIASKGKSWNASKILGVKQKTLYRESCSLLHEALLALSRQVRKEDPELAMRAATHALDRAVDSGQDVAVAAALYELGKSQLSAGDVKNALRNLSKLLAIAKRIPDPECICNAHTELAFAYKELEDSEGAVKHLSMLRQCAMQYELPYKLAQAHYYTGEYLLNKSQANLATPHLELALEQFSNLGKTTEAERARCTAGISKGQEVMDRYTNLILSCNKGNIKAIEKLCNWKNIRIPFWESTEVDLISKETTGGPDDDEEASKISTKSLLSLSSANKSSSITEAPFEQDTSTNSVLFEH